MEDSEQRKGKVMSLSSLFLPEETQKASERVQDTIAERRNQLDQLKSFVSDNTNLINLVQTLPNELQHQIMVPFGKAAFFPGRLIHTNEFMVLLGDGYYAERTSKQTVEILKRRGKILESQFESLKADIQDLKTEASFFNATANEAAGDLVEIVEDYVEENPMAEVSKAGESKADFPSSSEAETTRIGYQDDEYAYIFSRIDELEKEEEDAEKDDDDLDHTTDQRDYETGVYGSKVTSVHQDGSSHGGPQASSKPTEKALEPPEIKDVIQGPAVTKKVAFTGSIVEHTHNLETNPREPTVAPSAKPVSRFRMSRK
ncbi:uncharacterized protein [Coffea arabica]|uniref:Uncharacterized protein isoform X2 n=1 Tax=Coffea arabica TaxID=13443 RepID=A0A6P6X1B6_COFAR|nr:RNA polymerase II subunit 5-mediating protein homolog isoform X2 [Coffea arabica]